MATDLEIVIQAIDRATGELNSIKSALSGLESQSRSTGGALGNLLSTAGGVFSGMMAFGAVQSIFSGITDTVKGVAGSMIGLNAESESMGVALTTMFGNASKGAEAAGVSQEDLAAVTASTSGAIQQAQERMADAAEKHASTIGKLGREFEKVQADASKALADLEADFAEAMASIEAAHAKTMAGLDAREMELGSKFAAQMADRQAAFERAMGDLESSHANTIAKLNDQIGELGRKYQETVAGIEAAHAKAMAAIEAREAALSTTFAQQMADRKAAFDESMAGLEASHASTMARMEEQLAALQQRFEEAAAARAARYAEEAEEAPDRFLRERREHERTAEQIRKAMDEEVAKGTAADQALLASLQARLAEELAAQGLTFSQYQEQIAQRQQAEEKAAQEAEAKQIEALKRRMEQEDALYAARRTKLQAEYDKDLERAREAYNKQLEELQKRREEESRQHAEALKKAEEANQRQADALRKRMDDENAEYEKRRARLQQDYDRDVQKSQEAYAKQLEELKAKKAEEEAEFAEAMAKREEKYAEDVAKVKEAEAEKLAALKERMAEESAAYAKSARDAQAALDKSNQKQADAIKKLLESQREPINEIPAMLDKLEAYMAEKELGFTWSEDPNEAAKQQADAMLKWIAEKAAATPFDIPGINKLATQLSAYGLDTIKWLDTIGDTASGLQVPLGQVVGAVGALATGQTGEAVQRFRDMGINLRDAISMGLKFDAQGSLITPIDEALEIVKKLMDQKFGGLMEKQSTTWKGLMSTLADTWGQFQQRAGKPLFTVLNAELKTMMDWLAKNKGGLDAMADAVGLGLVTAFQNLKPTLVKLGEGLLAWIESGDAVKDVEKWGKAFGQLALAAVAVAGVILDLTTKFSGLPQPLQQSILYAGLAAGAFGTANLATGGLAGQLVTLALKMGGVVTGWGGMIAQEALSRISILGFKDAAYYTGLQVADLAGKITSIPSKTVKLAIDGAEAAKNAVQGMIDKIGMFVSKTVSLAVAGEEAAKTAIGNVIGKLSGLVDKTAKVVIAGEEAAKTAIGNVISKLGGLIDKTARLLIDGETAAKTAIQNVIDKLGNLKDKAFKIAASGVDTAKKALDDVLERLGKLADKAFNIAMSGATAVKSALDGVLERLGKLANKDISIGADTTKATEALKNLQKSIDGISDVKVKLNVDMPDIGQSGLTMGIELAKWFGLGFGGKAAGEIAKALGPATLAKAGLGGAMLAAGAYSAGEMAKGFDRLYESIFKPEEARKKVRPWLKAVDDAVAEFAQELQKRPLVANIVLGTAFVVGAEAALVDSIVKQAGQWVKDAEQALKEAPPWISVPLSIAILGINWILPPQFKLDLEKLIKDELDKLNIKMPEVDLSGLEGLPEKIGELLSGVPGKVDEIFADARDRANQDLKDIESFFTVTLPGWGGKIQGFIADIPGKVDEIFADARAQANKDLQDIEKFFTDTLPGWGDKIKGFISDIPGKVDEIFADARDQAKQDLKDIEKFFTDTLPGWGGKIKGFLEDIPGKVDEIFADARDQANKDLQDIEKFFTDTLPGWGGKIKGFIADIPGKVDEIFADARDRAKQDLKDIEKFFTDTLPGWGDKIKGLMGDIPGKVKGVLDDAKDAAKTAADGIWNAIKDAFQAGWDAIKQWLAEHPIPNPFGGIGGGGGGGGGSSGSAYAGDPDYEAWKRESERNGTSTSDAAYREHRERLARGYATAGIALTPQMASIAEVEPEAIFPLRWLNDSMDALLRTLNSVGDTLSMRIQSAVGPPTGNVPINRPIVTPGTSAPPSGGGGGSTVGGPTDGSDVRSDPRIRTRGNTNRPPGVGGDVGEIPTTPPHGGIGTGPATPPRVQPPPPTWLDTYTDWLSSIGVSLGPAAPAPMSQRALDIIMPDTGGWRPDTWGNEAAFDFYTRNTGTGTTSGKGGVIDRLLAMENPTQFYNNAPYATLALEQQLGQGGVTIIQHIRIDGNAIHTEDLGRELAEPVRRELIRQGYRNVNIWGDRA